MYDDVFYKRPFLKEVIVRIDFSSSLTSLKKEITPALAAKILERFPISEPRKAFAQELQISHDEFKHKREDYTEWNYHGRNKEKRLAIAPEYMFVTYSKYESFESLKVDFLSVLEVLFKNNANLHGRRLGLRYVNAIELIKRDPFSWEELIEEDLLFLFRKFRNERKFTTRLFNIVELKYEDNIQINFQFGVPNPDFPAPIRRPFFVLDIDAYFQGLIEIGVISEFLDKSHLKIQELFEQSIKDELRRIMNGE